MEPEKLLSKLRIELKKSVDKGKIRTFKLEEYYGFPDSFSIFTIYVDDILRGQLDEHNLDKVVDDFLNKIGS